MDLRKGDRPRSHSYAPAQREQRDSCSLDTKGWLDGETLSLAEVVWGVVSRLQQDSEEAA